MLLRDFIKDSRQALSQLYPAAEAAAIVDALCAALPGVTRVTHIVEPSFELPLDREPWLTGCVRRLAASEPLQYVLGRADFYGRSIAVSPAVLIPRPETELLVREVLLETEHRRAQEDGSRRHLRILDLCTGSGCIAWTLAAELPGAEVVAVDISREALAVAAAQNIEAAAAPSFIEADVLDPDFPAVLSRLCGIDADGSFDIIVSNPPYVREMEKALMRPNVLEHEPGIALFVPDGDPLIFYRAIARSAAALLAPGGFGCVEVNEALSAETEAAIASRGLANLRTIKDFCNKNRHIVFEK